MNCIHCGSSKLRTSRIRASDWVRLLIFQLPVRCRVCHERGYAGLLLSINLRQAERARRSEDRAAKRRHTSATNEH